MKNNNIKNKKNKGFTLVELLVVITIILVMLGFLVPKLYGYQLKAKQTKAINTAKQIQTAAMASYSEDNQNFVSTDVLASIGNLTGVDTSATSTTTVTPGSDGQNITVNFDSDGVSYTVGIDATSSGYTVSNADGQIFPKQ